MEYSRIAMHPLFQIRQNLRTCGARAPALRPVALHTIRERYGVARIGISGSVMQNEETPASDIDILVEVLKVELEDLLGRRTDLVIADTLKPRIRDAVLGEVVYAWGSPVVS